MAFSGEENEWLVDRADELGRRFELISSGELKSLSCSIADRRRIGEISHEILAAALASGREALRRATGIWIDSAVIRAVAAAVSGEVSTVLDRKSRRAALVMALYWHGLAGKGAHFLSWDTKGARDMVKYFQPFGMLLGCDAGLVTRSIDDNSRRSAYSASVTFGSCSEIAADYLRDNLHDSPANVVQRGHYAAVFDDAGTGMAAQAFSRVVITGPRSWSPNRDLDAAKIAASFRKGGDYRVDRKRRAILFSESAMLRLKTAVGWGVAPFIKAVAAAEQVEGSLLQREGLVKSDERETLAETTVRGYFDVYEVLTGFSSGGYSGRTVDQVLAEAEGSSSYLEELAFERLVDRQRSEIYEYRARIRDEEDVLSLLRPIVVEAVRVWLDHGVSALAAGLYETLAGWQTLEQINAALDGSLSRDDYSGRAVLIIEGAVGRRAEKVGNRRFTASFRNVLLTVIDVQWRDHISRVRYIQRQSGALYTVAGGVDEVRNADVESLFSACEQEIRVESLKYLLNVRI